MDGEKIGEIDKRGGTLSETVDGAASIELRVPAQYLDKILLNGSDVKSVLISSGLYVLLHRRLDSHHHNRGGVCRSAGGL